MSESNSVIPAVLLRTLSKYKFVGHPLWRMADGEDNFHVKLTFHKTLATLPTYKKRDESRRQPAPSADKWLHQPIAARRPPLPMIRPLPPACQQPTTLEKETPPPVTQTLQFIALTTITLPRSPKTAQIKPSPIIKKPTTSPPSPESPHAKKPRIK